MALQENMSANGTSLLTANALLMMLSAHAAGTKQHKSATHQFTEVLIWYGCAAVDEALTVLSLQDPELHGLACADGLGVAVDGLQFAVGGMCRV